MKQQNFGILASLSWNSNEWKDEALEQDVIHSNYEFVREQGYMEESFNFGFDTMPAEGDGYYIGSTPMFDSPPSLEESKFVEIVLFRSLDYNTGKNLIVGFYAFPIIAKFQRSTFPKGLSKYSKGNLKAKPENIVLFKKPLVINKEIVATQKLLPKGKEIGQRNFNYLYYENVLRILDIASKENPNDSKMNRVKYKFLTDKKFYSLKAVQ